VHDREARLQLAEGKIIADRFRLVRELGVGGMGSVWLAHHVGLDTPCAVKFIHAEVATMPDIRARFEREAKAAAQLRSSHVVQILDYGVWDSVPYIAMEFLEGEDLGERLKRCGRLSPHETVLIISQVARALTKAHAAGLIHRDLKPENIFLVPEDDHEIAKVLDFGIAKTHGPVLDNATTKAGALLGTPHYMSPEQAQGTKTIDYRSDLWSLAVLAFQCITGKLPFNSEALGDLILHIIVNPLPVPSHIVPDVPPTFDVWWARAAAREPAQRFQSAKELADALAVALGVTVALQPGMVPFAPLSTGMYSLSQMPSMPSLPSITPPQAHVPGKPGLDFDVDTLLANISPTTGPAVSLDGPDKGDRMTQRGRVPLALGLGVAAAALLAGVGLALWGRSYFQGPPTAGSAQVAAQVDGTAQGASPPPRGAEVASASPSSAATGAAPTSTAAATAPTAQGASPTSPATSTAAPPTSSSAPKLPLKPRKPKEKDFGF
jgi:serine/threonine-protein kinase